MKITTMAASLAVSGLLLVGCGGGSNTADYNTCKAMVKDDMSKSIAAISSGKLPENLPTAGAEACSRLSKDDITRLMGEVTNELQKNPPPIGNTATAQALQAQEAEQQAQSDLASLRPADSFTSDLNGLTSDVNRTGTDTATVKSDAALGTAAAGTACLNVATVDLDATTVGDDASIVSDDVSTLTGDIATAAQDIAALKNDMAALSASGLPAPPAAAAAVAAAGQAIKRAAAQANGEIDHVNTDVARAYGIARGLATGACSAYRLGHVPAPIRHISGK